MENNMKNTDIEVIKKVVIFTTNQGINISELSLKFNDNRKLLAHSINMCVNLMVYIEQSEARKEEVTVETIIRDVSGINHEFVKDVMDRYIKDGRKAIMKVLAEHKANGIEMNNDVSDVVDLMIQEVFPNRDNDKSMGQEAANIIEMCLKYNLRTELGELFDGLKKIDTKTTFLFAVDENGDINPACEEAVMNELRGHFRPEFLNRLDEIIMFKPLTKDNIGNIINLLMNDLNKRLADREITVELSDSARQFIVDHGYDPIYGARPLKRFLQKHVETLSAKLILADEVREGDTILIDTEGDKLTARVK